jgi:hypothetical protein
MACKFAQHPGLDCAEAKLEWMRATAAELGAYSNTVALRQCPACGHLIEHAGGCNEVV